jgi:molybdopterin-containing oxidoreductase family membrane subunit
LLLVVAPAYFFFFLTDFYFGIFSRDPNELQIWNMRLFQPPTNILFFVQIATLLMPVPFWFVHRFRRHTGIMLWTSLSVNVGMWLERYLLVVTPLQLKQPFTFGWLPTYVPSVVESIATIASFALVALGLIAFAKILPIVPLWDEKEGQVLSTTVRVGRLDVPAAARTSDA